MVRNVNEEKKNINLHFKVKLYQEFDVYFLQISIKSGKTFLYFSLRKEELFVISYHVSSSYMMPPSFAKWQAKNQMINGILKQVAKKEN